MKRKNIAFPDPVADDLEKIAEEKDITLPEVVRKAVDEYIEKWKRSGKSK